VENLVRELCKRIMPAERSSGADAQALAIVRKHFIQRLRELRKTNPGYTPSTRRTAIKYFDIGAVHFPHEEDGYIGSPSEGEAFYLRTFSDLASSGCPAAALGLREHDAPGLADDREHATTCRKCADHFRTPEEQVRGDLAHGGEMSDEGKSPWMACLYRHCTEPFGVKGTTPTPKN
jgi:hypothetical protein